MGIKLSSQSVQPLSTSAGTISKSSGALSVQTGQSLKQIGQGLIKEQIKKCQRIDVNDLTYQPAIKDPDGIKDQGNQGTCYAQAIVTCIRCTQARNQIPPTHNDQHKIYLDMIITKFGKHGAQLRAVLEWTIPQVQLKWKKIVHESTNQKDAIIEMKGKIVNYLNQGIPILISVTWTSDALTSDKKVVSLKRNHHAMVIMELKEDYWLVQNSWGGQAHVNGIVKIQHQLYFNQAYIVYGLNDKTA